MDLTPTRRLLAPIALALAVGACGDDPAEPEGELTEEEAVALVVAVTTFLADTTVVPIHASEDSIVVECPSGGRAKIVGKITEEEGDTARIGVDLLVTPTGCGLAVGEQRFNLGPGLALRNQLSIEIVGATFEVNIDGMMTGGLDWELDDRTGDCMIDLTLEAAPDLSDPDNPGIQGKYTGALCGHGDVEIDAEDLLLVNDL